MCVRACARAGVCFRNQSFVGQKLTMPTLTSSVEKFCLELVDGQPDRARS